MDKKRFRKIEDDLVIVIILGMVLSSVSINANGNELSGLDKEWDNKYIDKYELHPLGYYLVANYVDMGKEDGFIIVEHWYENGVNDRDFLLLKIRDITFSSKNEYILTCPSNECGKKIN